jgi:hypothetical protein
MKLHVNNCSDYLLDFAGIWHRGLFKCVALKSAAKVSDTSQNSAMKNAEIENKSVLKTFPRPALLI